VCVKVCCEVGCDVGFILSECWCGCAAVFGWRRAFQVKILIVVGLSSFGVPAGCVSGAIIYCWILFLLYYLVKLANKQFPAVLYDFFNAHSLNNIISCIITR